MLTLPPADPFTDDQPEPAGSDDPDSSRSDDPLPGPITIDLVLNTEEPDPPIAGWLDGLLRRAVERCGIRQAGLTLVIVEDGEMAELHERYTGVAGTTDVLTFDLTAPAEGASEPGPPTDTQTLEADIILCIDEARRQAEQRDHSEREELLLYAVHGLMHLLGEDDHTEADYQHMHAREDALLKQLGVGPLFYDTRSSDPRP